MVDKIAFCDTVRHIINRYHKTKALYEMLSSNPETYEDMIDLRMMNIAITDIAQGVSDGANWIECRDVINEYIGYNVEPEYADSTAFADEKELYDFCVENYGHAIA